MIRRTVLEWKRIAYGQGEKEIPEWAADRLAAVAWASPLGGEGGAHILAHGRRDLRAGQVVGVVAAEGCSLEILPKIDGLGEGEDDFSRGLIRRRLVHMLAVAIDVDIAGGRVTELGWQRDNVLEILIGLFTRKLADAVRLGLPRSYISHEEELPALRGRLNAIRQFTTLAASPQKLACRYDALSPDVTLNRIMKAAIARLSHLSRSTENRRLLRELALAYVDIADLQLAAFRWDEVVLDRTNQRWRELLGLARLLLGERFQTTTTGEAQGFSLLFEMNTLFEEYVARLLGRSLAKDGLTVKRQGGRLYCLKELDDEGRSRFQTIPDILVKRGTDILLVIDTKWKRLSPRIEDPKQGISQADVYQIMAYARIYQCLRVMLLYPHHAGLSGSDGLTAQYRLTGSTDELGVATIDIGKAENVAERLAAIVSSHLAPSSFS